MLEKTNPILRDILVPFFRRSHHWHSIQSIQNHSKPTEETGNAEGILEFGEHI